LADNILEWTRERLDLRSEVILGNVLISDYLKIQFMWAVTQWCWVTLDISFTFVKN